MPTPSVEVSDLSAVDPQGHTHSSGISWGAVIGGAFVAAALSLIMLALGAGFGLSVVSPWSSFRRSSVALGAAAIIWLILMQAIPYALGGYLAGRLRTRWRLIHTDEVHFRDTANGFLVWAVGVVIAAAFLTTAAVWMAGGSSAGREPALGSAGAAQEDVAAVPGDSYFVDRLFPPERGGAEASDALAHAEAGRVLAHALAEENAPPADVAYLAQLVTAKTGVSPADAQRRVSDIIMEARQAEDAARKNLARVLLWTFLALLIGAFCASYAATIGGRQRDQVKPLQH